MVERDNVRIALKEFLYSKKAREILSPLFYDYFKDSIFKDINGFDAYYQSVLEISQLVGGFENKKIIDIGCGLGIRSICVALLDAKSVTAIDISSEMIDDFSKVLGNIQAPLAIKLIKADFLNRQVGKDYFDIAILVEAISHIRDTDLLLAKIRYCLAPGGLFYIQDANNDMILRERMKIREQWRRSEKGPIDVAMAKHGRKIDRLSFFEARKKIVKKAFPDLNLRDVDKISAKTQGMYGDQILKAAEEYLSKGFITQKASFPYRNPYSGEYPELGINYFRLKKMLKRKGFETRLIPRQFLKSLLKINLDDDIKNEVKRIINIFLRIPFIAPFFTRVLRIIAVKKKW